MKSFPPQSGSHNFYRQNLIINFQLSTSKSIWVGLVGIVNMYLVHNEIFEVFYPSPAELWWVEFKKSYENRKMSNVHEAPSLCYERLGQCYTIQITVRKVNIINFLTLRLQVTFNS